MKDRSQGEPMDPRGAQADKGQVNLQAKGGGNLRNDKDRTYLAEGGQGRGLTLGGQGQGAGHGRQGR